jgi:replication-associated recombination protein RarA
VVIYKSTISRTNTSTKLEDYISQSTSGTKWLFNSTNSKGIIPSLLWGPPGTGKTTLAQIIAQESKRSFYILSAINSGVKDIREVIEKRNKVEVFSPPRIQFYL